MGDYSSGDEATLPTTTANLEHVYDATDLTNVGTDDTNYVNQTATGEYAIHQYKDSITAGNANVTWKGKSSVAPSSSKVQLQVYKVAAPAAWEDVSGSGASNNAAAADTDFTLTGTIATANYLDSGVTTFRIYQAAVASPIIDSFTTSDASVYMFSGNYTAWGQAFTGDGRTIGTAKFYLLKAGTVTGNVLAKIYAAGTGTFGDDLVPGTLLGTSGAVLATSVGGEVSWITFTFTGAEQVATVAGTKYVAVVEYTSTGDDANCIYAYVNTTGGHAGNDSYYRTGAWSRIAGWDVLFEVDAV